MPLDVPEPSRCSRVLPMWEPYFRPRMNGDRLETGRWYWFVLLPVPCTVLGERVKFRTREDAEGFWNDWEAAHGAYTRGMQVLQRMANEERDHLMQDRRQDAAEAARSNREEDQRG